MVTVCRVLASVSIANVVIPVRLCLFHRGTCHAWQCWPHSGGPPAIDQTLPNSAMVSQEDRRY